MDKSYKPSIIVFLSIVVLCTIFVCIDVFTDIRDMQYQKRNEELLLDNVEIERKWLQYENR